MKIPYGLVAAVDVHKRHAQMALALQHGFPRLQQVPIDDARTLTIACYGPSLAQTYQTMTRPILSMSGATRWLADHGVISDLHVEMDPRPHKVKHLDPPVDGVHYLMASVCHPDVWKLLDGQQVTLWHTYSAKETYDVVASLDHGQLVIHGGSTIGLTALHVGGVLGYRHFEIHGMDGSFNDDTRSARHAGPHYGTKQQDGITWDAGGVRYQTSKIMANAVSETLNAVANFPMFCVFHGQGLTQALVREHQYPTACCVDETERVTKIRTATAHILDAIQVQPQEKTNVNSASLWDVLCAPLQADWETELAALKATNEARRKQAAYNTGSITLAQMLQLRRLCVKLKPKVAVEIGTFIGNSTLALQAKHVYTCDKDNDCLPSTGAVKCFPKQSSTQMLRWLTQRDVQADVFFFDGRIQMEDLPLIQKLTKPESVFVFDDYVDTQKGVINVKRLASVLPEGWVLVEPDHRVPDSTFAALAPTSVFP